MSPSSNPEWRDPDYLDYLREARRKLTEFTEWLVRSCALSQRNADVTTAIVCRTIWEFEDPVDKLSDDYLTRPNYTRIKGALKRYYTWKTIRKGVTPGERAFGRTQLNIIAQTVPPGDLYPPRTNRLKVDPIPQAKFVKALRLLPEWAKGKPRWPWARGVLALKMKIAPGNMLAYIQREDLARALADGPEWGTIELWGKSRKKAKSRLIPISLIEEEAELLVRWPWDWRILADVVSPYSSTKRRPNAAQTAVSKATTAFLEETIGFRPEAPGVTGPALKYATWVWILRKLKGDWLSLSRIAGVSEQSLRERPFLLAVTG